MSKEILFRGKTENGRWAEGAYVPYEDGGACIFVKPFSKYGYESIDIGRRVKVDPSTVCQYTGLTDKKDVKIFENDIVTFAGYSKDNRGWVRFGSYSDARGMADTNYGWFIEFIENNGYYRQDFGYWVNKIIVIGNYFDNPELLEGGTGEDD